MRASNIIFEVERKFLGLTRVPFVANAGTPNFGSLNYLGEKRFTDTYYDKDDTLSAKGIWLRQRQLHGKESSWEAKISKGGTMNNSLFEELTDISAITEVVSKLTGETRTESNKFGLDILANLTTNRKTWHADEQFKVVLDSTDFGHEVGEVELECELIPPSNHSTDEEIEAWKRMKLQAMDRQIDAFMRYYSWAFRTGTPQGKLTAYFKQ